MEIVSLLLDSGANMEATDEVELNMTFNSLFFVLFANDEIVIIVYYNIELYFFFIINYIIHIFYIYKVVLFFLEVHAIE